jgi:hypothetical protein
MPSLTAKDRVSLCLFSFTDGRRCRTPRAGHHPHFCFYHAQKEAQARAAESLAKDLANFFSGDYLSACDLSTALARLIPAVIRGDVKPPLTCSKLNCKPSTSPSMNTSTPSALMAGAKPSAPPSTSTMTTASHPTQPPPPTSFPPNLHHPHPPPVIPSAAKILS